MYDNVLLLTFVNIQWRNEFIFTKTHLIVAKEKSGSKRSDMRKMSCENALTFVLQ